MIAQLLAISTLAGSVLAQSEVHQSAPFNLAIVSDNKTIDGLKLAACHTGAAIESLCISPASSPSQFYFNYTTYEGSTTPTPVGGQPGILGYALQTSSDQPYNQAMGLYTDISTNVGLPLFGSAGILTSLAFDKNEFMNLQSNLVDTQTPPNGTGPANAYYRWYICETYFLSYTYSTLAWVYGDKEPQNPSCVKTDIKRVFTSGYY